MILLTDVATKLEEILNSEDNPCDFSFIVKSAGYHLDSVSNKKKGVNQIPVFVSQIGGENNPVPNLKQVNYSYEVNIYYPVRFKDDFYNINSYFQEVFVGKKLSFGSDIALCNINVAEYGEIIDFDAIREFENWVQENFDGESVHLFKRDEQVNEFYMSMKFRIYATSLGEGFMFGNDLKFTLIGNFPAYKINTLTVANKTSHSSYTYTRYATGDDATNQKYCFKYTYNTTEKIIYTDVYPTADHFEEYVKNRFKIYEYNAETQTYVELGSNFEITNKTFSTDPYPYTSSTELVFRNGGTGMSVSPVSQQRNGVDKFAKNIANITNYNKSLLVYPQDNDFWTRFLYAYNIQDMKTISSLTLVKNYGNNMKFEFNQLVLSLNENIELGEPLSLTITYGDRK